MQCSNIFVVCGVLTSSGEWTVHASLSGLAAGHLVVSVVSSEQSRLTFSTAEHTAASQAAQHHFLVYLTMTSLVKSCQNL